MIVILGPGPDSTVTLMLQPGVGDGIFVMEESTHESQS